MLPAVVAVSIVRVVDITVAVVVVDITVAVVVVVFIQLIFLQINLNEG